MTGLIPGGAYVLLHTLAHLLIQSLALRCGYPAASIRERIFADHVQGRYALVLYTASPDAEGTLGGLVQEARRIEQHLEQAFRTAALCSNDPGLRRARSRTQHGGTLAPWRGVPWLRPDRRDLLRDAQSPESLVRRFADAFWTKDWPGAARPTVYYDPRSVAVDGPSGVLHAKAVVVDEESVFVTSANLTEAAFDRNIELGLLVRDRTLAATTLMHFRTLIEKNLLRRLPAS